MEDLQDDVLFFNVFGVAVVISDRVTVAVNFYKAGRPRTRTLDYELSTESARLENVDRPLLVPFAAFLTEREIDFVPGRFTDHDVEVYVANKTIIDPIIKKAIGLSRGSLLSKG